MSEVTEFAPASEAPAAEAPPAGAPAAEAPPATGEPPAAATESEAGAQAHGFASLDDAVAEVRKVREEAANRRVALKPYEEAFSGFDDESRGVYLELAKQIASGDPELQKAAAARFREIAERIDGSEVSTKPTGEPDPKQKPLTIAEWESLQAQAQQEAEIQAGIKQIESDAAAAGIDLYNSPTGAAYLWALQQPDVAGDHEKALELVEKERQAAVDAYAKKVAEGAEKWPSVAPSAAVAGDEAPPPANWKDAAKRTQAFIKARAGQVTE
jgi:hypothetical protein